MSAITELPNSHTYFYEYENKQQRCLMPETATCGICTSAYRERVADVTSLLWHIELNFDTKKS